MAQRFYVIPIADVDCEQRCGHFHIQAEMLFTLIPPGAQNGFSEAARTGVQSFSLGGVLWLRQSLMPGYAGFGIEAKSLFSLGVV